MKKYHLVLFVLLFLETVVTAYENRKAQYLSVDDGTRLYVEKSGSGPVCIFIHGGPGAWSKSFEDLGGKQLESVFSMVYYDQRGCGRSEDSPDKDYSIKRMVKDIEQIRCCYGQDKVYLLSHSFGGILAANYALRYPEHVKALLFANCTLNMKDSMTQQIRYMDTLLNRDFTAVPDDPGLLLNNFMQIRQSLPENLTYKVLSDNEESVRDLEKIDESNPSDCEFAQKAFTLPEYWQDFTDCSKNIKVPVLIITGGKDHSVGPDHYLSFQFPNETIRKINGGHLLYYEENSEFRECITSFVRNLE